MLQIIVFVLTLTWLALANPSAAQCQADVVADGRVDGSDLGAVLGAWGLSGDGIRSDINGDGRVNGTDLTILLSAWGSCVQIPEWAVLVEAIPDPTVVYNAAQRQAIIETGYAWRVMDRATQIEMVLIPRGTFNMGCGVTDQSDCYAWELPVHQVTLSRSFYMARYEVTQGQWQTQMGNNPSYFQGDSNRPVEQVSWNNIQGFLSATGMRLPTEAEWEYACRAGTETAFHGWTGNPNGTNEDNRAGIIAWFEENSGDQPHSVGGKAGNGFGLHDMGGNVWEWVNDWYSSSYYASSPAQNPTGPSSGLFRAYRGGAWYSPSNNVTSFQRGGELPDELHWAVGFRVVRSL